MAEILCTGLVQGYRKDSGTSSWSTSSNPSITFTKGSSNHNSYTDFATASNFRFGASYGSKTNVSGSPSSYVDEITGTEYTLYKMSQTRTLYNQRLQFKLPNYSADEIASASLIFTPSSASSSTHKYGVAVVADGNSTTPTNFIDYDNSVFGSYKKEIEINGGGKKTFDITNLFKQMINVYGRNNNGYLFLLPNGTVARYCVLPYNSDFTVKEIKIEYELAITKPTVNSVKIKTPFSAAELKNGLDVTVGATDGVNNRISKYKWEIYSNQSGTAVLSSESGQSIFSIQSESIASGDYTLRVYAIGGTSIEAYQESDAFVVGIKCVQFPKLNPLVEFENCRVYNDDNLIYVLGTSVKNNSRLTLSANCNDEGVEIESVTLVGDQIKTTESRTIIATLGQVSDSLTYIIQVEAFTFDGEWVSKSGLNNKLQYKENTTYAGVTWTHSIGEDEVISPLYLAKYGTELNIITKYNHEEYGLLETKNQSITLGSLPEIELRIAESSNPISDGQYYFNTLYIQNTYVDDCVIEYDFDEKTAGVYEDENTLPGITGFATSGSHKFAFNIYWAGQDNPVKTPHNFTLNRVYNFGTQQNKYPKFSLIKTSEETGFIGDSLNGKFPYQVQYLLEHAVGKEVYDNYNDFLTYKIYIGNADEISPITFRGEEPTVDLDRIKLSISAVSELTSKNLMNNFTSESYDNGGEVDLTTCYMEVLFTAGTQTFIFNVQKEKDYTADVSGFTDKPTLTLSGGVEEEEKIGFVESDTYTVTSTFTSPNRPYKYILKVGKLVGGDFTPWAIKEIDIKAQTETQSIELEGTIPFNDQAGAIIAAQLNNEEAELENNKIYAYSKPVITYFAEILDDGTLQIQNLNIATNNEYYKNSLNEYTCKLYIQGKSRTTQPELNLIEKGYLQINDGAITSSGDDIILTSTTQFPFQNGDQAYIYFFSPNPRNEEDGYGVNSETYDLIILTPLVHYEPGRLAINNYTFGPHSNAVLLIEKSDTYDTIVLGDGVKINLGNW